MSGAPHLVPAGAAEHAGFPDHVYGTEPGASQTSLNASTHLAAPGSAATAPTGALPGRSFQAAAGATLPFPAAGPAGEDPYEAYFRPPPGQPSPHTMTTVMPSIPAQAQSPEQGYADQGYPEQPYPARAGFQPAYDQPIDYQAGPERPYSEPYEGPYADDYPGAPAEPRSSRAAKIGVGVAAGAVLVIIISLVTLGGGKSSGTPQAGNNQATEVVNPTPAQGGTAVQPQPGATGPTAPGPTIHTPGQLQLGDSGPEVRWLQARLKQLNLYDGPVNGTFDQATLAAVKAFQASRHTSDPSGVVARSTKTALIAAGSRPRMSVFNPGGDGGGKKGKDTAGTEDVKRLQRALATALNQDVKATGTYDAATMGAVMQYQAQVGLMPDGMVGDKVWGALQQGKLTA